MDRRIGSLTRSTARLSASPFRMLQCSPRRSARWRSFATISNSVNSSLRSTRRSARCGQWLRPCRRHRKKTAEIIQREVAREVEQLLRVIFRDRKATGRLDLESIETVIRAALLHAGGTTLTQLLQWEPPDADHLTAPCSCGHTAHYKELRDKTFLSVVGPVTIRRPYYHCSICSTGQHPHDCH